MKHKSLDQKKEECSVERFCNESGKWTLVKKIDKSIISDTWFDSLGTWSSYSSSPGNEYDIFGWDGLVFLESPIKTDGAYPYSVKAKIYHHSSEGELIKVFENTCGIWSP